MGLLGSTENISVIAGSSPIIPACLWSLDPVLASGRGDELADEEMIAGLCELLLPLTTILTPNTLEAQRSVCGRRRGDADDDQESRPSTTVRRVCSTWAASMCC
jgi:hydroxymethylpyrimidine/phosphomethylpyrimidine kinase